MSEDYTLSDFGEFGVMTLFVASGGNPGEKDPEKICNHVDNYLQSAIASASGDKYTIRTVRVLEQFLGDDSDFKANDKLIGACLYGLNNGPWVRLANLGLNKDMVNALNTSIGKSADQLCALNASDSKLIQGIRGFQSTITNFLDYLLPFAEFAACIKNMYNAAKTTEVKGVNANTLSNLFGSYINTIKTVFRNELPFLSKFVTAFSGVYEFVLDKGIDFVIWDKYKKDLNGIEAYIGEIDGGYYSDRFHNTINEKIEAIFEPFTSNGTDSDDWCKSWDQYFSKSWNCQEMCSRRIPKILDSQAA